MSQQRDSAESKDEELTVVMLLRKIVEKLSYRERPPLAVLKKK